jgi:FixJ family two-component response regulator
MEQHITFHIVGGSSRSRAEQARFIYSRGFHAELYAELGELIHRAPAGGLIVACGELLERGVDELVDRLGSAGIWLSIVAASDEPQVPQIVRAVKQGAFDYLALPVQQEAFDRLLARIAAGEAERDLRARRAIVEARTSIAMLSRRERQVLDWLCEGSSNKHIARALDISPRTVEIHRANMMEKLGVQHAAEAVRLQFIAALQSTARSVEAGSPQRDAEAAPPITLHRQKDERSTRQHCAA